MKHLPTLHLPLESEYKIVQTDASLTGWGGILLAITNIGEEKLCKCNWYKYGQREKHQ